jgi:PAS domain S-box-containing protein
VAVLVLGLLLLLPAPAASEPRPREVLLLHSFERDFAPFDVFARELKTALTRGSARPVIFYDVSVTLSRSIEPAVDTPFIGYLREAFKEGQLDLVVSIGGPAARFAQRYRRQLFPSIPLLYAAVDQFNLDPRALTEDDALIAVSNDPRLVVRTILQLLPRTRTVAVVSGSSVFERQWKDRVRPQLEEFADRVAVTWLDHLSFSQMLERVRTLPPDSAIFYGLLRVDAGGVAVTEGQALPALHDAANAPIFGLHSTQLGSGVVGGQLMPIEALAEDTARAASRILEGEVPARLSRPARTATTWQFDARELRRWRIDPARLPAGSVVRFQEPTIWDLYKWPLLGAVAIGLVQASLIAALLVSLVRRRRAEHAMIESSTRLTTILDTAGEGIVTINENGVIESINAAAAALFGWAAADMAGQPVAAIMPTIFQDGGADAAGVAGLPQVVGLREIAGRRKDGSIVPLELAVRETALVSRRVFTCCVRDITERKLAAENARRFGQRLLQAQEAERARVARELHDDVTQRLSQLAMDASRVERYNDRLERRQSAVIVHEIRDGLVRLSEDVHTLAYRLHPAFLAHVGLAGGLKAECDAFARQQSMRVRTSLEAPPPRVPADTALCLYRVAQEALQNVARHARASSVSVSLKVLGNGLELTVADDGAGFDPHRQLRPSLGLASMRERIEALGGTLSLASAPGRGTTIVARLPVQEVESWSEPASCSPTTTPVSRSG